MRLAQGHWKCIWLSPNEISAPGFLPQLPTVGHSRYSGSKFGRGVDTKSIHFSVSIYIILSTYYVPNTVLVTFMYIISWDYLAQFQTPASTDWHIVVAQ